MSPSEIESLLAEQIAFYRADARPFEAWHREVFERGGGGCFGESCRRDRMRMLEDLQRVIAGRRVLELAAGTGVFTASLLERALHVTAVDASPESMAIARAKLGRHSERVSFVEADLFGWRPTCRYDAVAFSYWLSHVPLQRFEEFWGLVGDALADHGVVFFVDSPAGSSNPGIPGHYREEDDPASHVSHRELAGRRYRVVRVGWRPHALERALARCGWKASLRLGERSLWGTVVRERRRFG